MAATIALAGNPNAGKTTLFNVLTGARQHVGNYPGVTVEKKEGTYSHKERKFHIVDLPGIYSLTAYSLEEVVARNFLVNEHPAAIIDIVDASNLERNLYLTIQLLELNIPVCIALNMMDVAGTRGISINPDRLSELLGAPVIPMVARNGAGKMEVMAASEKVMGRYAGAQELQISYGEDIDRALGEMSALIERKPFLTATYPARWVALKYLEADEQIKTLGREADPVLAETLVLTAARLSEHLKRTLNTYPEALIAEHRYGYIRSILKMGAVTCRHRQDRLFVSDKIDMLATNRFAGPAIAAAIIFALYQFVFFYSAVPVGWLEHFFGTLGSLAETHLPDGLLKSLIISGVIEGVGGVLGFVPLLMFMFFGISILEDSGYLARIAFMLDRVFRVFGLHGNSVMAFIVSGGIAGGCAVPGVMATRTLKSRRERLATLLTVPFMNCGAKLPVFALLVAAFFSKNQALFMFLITLAAWGGALLVAKLLRSTLIKGDSEPFVMELPPYRVPTLKGLLIHTWERSWQYVKKAGTVVLSISILLWAMMSFPALPEREKQAFEAARKDILTSVPAHVVRELGSTKNFDELSSKARSTRNAILSVKAREGEAALKNSIAGRIGTSIEKITRWAGFDWRTNIALVGGFAAKEIIVSTLGTAHSLGEIDPENTEALSRKLAASRDWGPLKALALIFFVMFYSPCFVAVVCISREAGSWKWGAFSMVFNTLLAFSLAVIIFQTGSALGV